MNLADTVNWRTVMQKCPAGDICPSSKCQCHFRPSTKTCWSYIRRSEITFDKMCVIDSNPSSFSRLYLMPVENLLVFGHMAGELYSHRNLVSKHDNSLLVDQSCFLMFPSEIWLKMTEIFYTGVWPTAIPPGGRYTEVPCPLYPGLE